MSREVELADAIALDAVVEPLENGPYVRGANHVLVHPTAVSTGEQTHAFLSLSFCLNFKCRVKEKRHVVGRREPFQQASQDTTVYTLTTVLAKSGQRLSV